MHRWRQIKDIHLCSCDVREKIIYVHVCDVCVSNVMSPQRVSLPNQQVSPANRHLCVSGQHGTRRREGRQAVWRPAKARHKMSTKLVPWQGFFVWSVINTQKLPCKFNISRFVIKYWPGLHQRLGFILSRTQRIIPVI